MSRYFYDLHIHSCLSPCADDDMTPANIAGMASLNGLTLVALTDHNTSKNCPAFFAHAKKYGIVPVAGMELTTAEDIHVLCLFPTLESAMDFDAEVEKRRVPVPNRPDIFGNQFRMDENDAVIGEEPMLLINATTIPIGEAWQMADRLGGVAVPAHIDRESGGMIAVLGDFVSDPPFASFELNDPASLTSYRERYPILNDRRYVVSSDSHHLWTLSEAVNGIDLADEPYSSAAVRASLIAYLKGA